MRKRHLGLALTALLSTTAALAQEAAAPGGDAQILLPDAPASAPAPTAAPAQPQSQAPAAAPVPPAPAATPSTGPLPAIGGLARNATAGAVQDRTWNIGLRAPGVAVSDRITMGASLTQPGILRLTGEEAEIALALSLPAESTVPASFRLVLRSSVNDLPDRSAVTVSVNGQEAGTWPLSSIGDWGQISVPGTALRHGVNTIGLALRQQHRIFCGPQASFDVWTEIDLPASGVTLPEQTVALNATNFRGGMTSAVQRGQPIDVRMDEGLPTASLTAAMTAIGRILPERATTRIRSPYDPVDADSSRRVGVSLREGTGAPATVTFLRSPRGALVMQVTDGPGLAELLATTLPPLPPAEDQTRLTPGRTTSFKDLGTPLIVRNTHYALAEVPFTLPGDWMNLSSQRAMLTLDYGYGANLPGGSTLLAKVNGETVVLLPLDVNGGKVQPPLPVRFPTHLLHGGRNAVTFEMIVPGDPPTLACPTRDSDMLVVLNSSTLNVPPTPPMTFGTLAGGLRAIGPEEVTAAGSESGFLSTFIGQLALTPATAGTGRLVLAQLPEDFDRIGDGLPLSREQIAHVFQAPRSIPAQGEDVPQFFNLGGGSPEAARPEAEPEPEGPRWTDRAAARLRALTSPEGEPLSDWILNRPGSAILMAPQDPAGTWTLVADGQLAPEVLARSFDGFRRSEAAQGARVAVRGEDGSWQAWPPNPRPHVTGPVPVRQVFQVIGNFASWAPGYYALILVVLALLSTIPAFIYVIVTRRDRTL